MAVYFHGSQRLEVDLDAFIPRLALVFITVLPVRHLGQGQVQEFASSQGSLAAGRSDRPAVPVDDPLPWPRRQAETRTSDDVLTINDLALRQGPEDADPLDGEGRVALVSSCRSLRIKQDAVPGLRISVWFDADQAGTLRAGLRRALWLGAWQDARERDGSRDQEQFDDWQAQDDSPESKTRARSRGRATAYRGPGGEMSRR